MKLNWNFLGGRGDQTKKPVGPGVWIFSATTHCIILFDWQVESQLTTAEEITFKYAWGTYDLLILPPSFPYGGMENPCLTFVTPTLLVGEGVRILNTVGSHYLEFPREIINCLR